MLPLHRSSRRVASSVLALLLAFGPVATAGIASAADFGVTITDTLDPKDLTVPIGSTVIWTNSDSERHRMRSRNGPVEFDSGNLEPGQAFQFSFSVVGTYTYVDDRDDANAAYHGTVVVTDAAPPGGEEPPPGGEPPPPTAGDVSIVNRSYQPGSLTVGVGATVTWANNDDRVHTVTARDRAFDSGIFDTGGSYSRSFLTAGTFEYFCTVHPDMVASITVVAGPGDPPPEPAPPPPAPAPPAPPAPAPVTSDVSVFDFGFSPAARTVNVGDSVSWANTGDAPHTVTARDGSFDSGFLFTGEAYSRTFSAPGTFEYFCTIHPEMVATITAVGTAAGASPEPPPTETPTAAPAASSGVTAVSGDVSIRDNLFSPASITVDVGSTVAWGNNGQAPHTVTTAGFDSGLIMPGERFRRSFATAGSFDYFCTIHPGMTGTVNVVTAAGGTGQSAATEEAVAAQNSPPVSGEQSPLEGATAVRAATLAVDIIDLDFDPRVTTVAVGDGIEWTNVGALPHTVTGSFGDSGFLEPGASYTQTFFEPGTFEYLCTIHPTMVGTVVVVEAAAVSGESAEAAPVVVAPGGQPPLLASIAAPEDGTPWGPVAVTIGILAVAAAFLVAGAGPKRPRSPSKA